MFMYFIIKSYTKCRNRCNFDVNGRILGAKCPLFLVSMPQRWIRLLCISPVVHPFCIFSWMPFSLEEWKLPGCFNTFFMQLFGVIYCCCKSEQPWDWRRAVTIYRDASVVLFCVASLSNGNNNLTHKNMNRRVPIVKFLWIKPCSLLHKEEWFFFLPKWIQVYLKGRTFI